MDRRESDGEVVSVGASKPLITEANGHPGALSNVVMLPQVSNNSCWLFCLAEHRRGEPCRHTTESIFWVREHIANSGPHAGPLKTQGAS